MMNFLRITVLALTVLFAGMMIPGQAEALLAKHECSFCHTLHGGTSSLVPLNSPTNIEVLCMSCHLTANGTTDAVQPHRTDDSREPYPRHYITCIDCHEVHDNMPNWRLNDPNHASHDDALGRTGGDVRPSGWPVGVNDKMVGRGDPDNETPYAIIITREADYNKDGIPDRVSEPQGFNCDPLLINDCYVTGKRHVIFENSDPDAAGKDKSSIHAWADNNEDRMQPSDASAWGETIPDWGDNDAAPHDAICHLCHSQTDKNYCGLDGDGNYDCTVHNDSKTCTACHTHDQCFDNNGTCEVGWSMPNRDLRVDTVSAPPDPPAEVTAGANVTITVDVSNFGDTVEDIQVRFSSDIEGSLGFTTLTNVAGSGGTAQAIFAWTTVQSGTHTITADIVPVLGEVATGNNSSTDMVIVVGAN